MKHALDAGPMIAYLDGEPGAPIVAKLLVENPSECFAHIFNLTEIYYVYFRRGGAATAENAIQTLLSAGVIARHDNDDTFGKKLLRSRALMHCLFQTRFAWH